MWLNRTCWLYLYLVLAMVICFLLGNATAHSQNTSNQNTNSIDWIHTGPNTYVPLNIPASSDRFTLTHYFATGDAFYMDKDSFEASADGKIHYKIIGKNLRQTNGKDMPTQESDNVVDCNTGTFLPQISRKQFDLDGNVISQDTFANVQPITMAAGSPLYTMLKDACEDNFATPSNPLPWIKK